MRNAAKCLFVAPVLLLVIAACGGGSEATATPPARPTNTPAAATATPSPAPAISPTPSGPAPKYGGTLTGFNNANPVNFDLVTESQGDNLKTEKGMYNGLLQFCPAGAGGAGDVCPDLAQKWVFSDDGKKLTFNLFPNVKWHDGTAFSSADVVFTFNRMLDPNVPSPISGALIRPYLQSIEAPDANTIVMNLKVTSSTVLPTLASSWFITQAKHIYTRDGKFTDANITGTGPFKLKEWAVGSSFEVQKNSSYFHPEWPYLDGMKFLILPDTNTAIAAFKLGRVQLPPYFAGWNPAQWNDIKKDMGDKVAGNLAPTLSTGAFLMNHTIKPFDDPRVRRAMRITMDMHEIIDKALDGGGLAGVVLDPEAHGQFALPYDEIKNLPGVRKPTAEDLATAKKLLADAGYPNGVNVKLQWNTSQAAIGETQVALVTAQYKKIGVTFEVVGEDTRTIYTNMAKGNFFFAPFLPRGVFTPDPQSTFTTYFTKEATLNYSHYVDPVLDQLYNEQFASLDEKKRVQLVHDLQRQVLKFEGATSPDRWDRGAKGYHSNIKDLRLGLSPYDGWTFERVWIDK